MLIPWSGGIDSSVILYDALYWWYGGQDLEWSAYCHLDDSDYKFNKNDQIPRAISYRCNQLPNKQQELEAKARNKLLTVFKRKKWDFEFKELNFDTSESYPVIGSFPQPLMWLSISALIVRDHEPLILGWHRGDDALNYIEEFSRIWKMLTELNGKKNSKLLLPFRCHRKHEIINRAKKLKILTKCWYCEFPTKSNRPCKNCDSCYVMIAANAVIDQQKKNKQPESISVC